MADVWTQRHADAEALCNLWGTDPNDENAWTEAWNFAPEWRKDRNND